MHAGDIGVLHVAKTSHILFWIFVFFPIFWIFWSSPIFFYPSSILDRGSTAGSAASTSGGCSRRRRGCMASALLGQLCRSLVLEKNKFFSFWKMFFSFQFLPSLSASSLGLQGLQRWLFWSITNTSSCLHHTTTHPNPKIKKKEQKINWNWVWAQNNVGIKEKVVNGRPFFWQKTSGQMLREAWWMTYFYVPKEGACLIWSYIQPILNPLRLYIIYTLAG